MYLKELNKTMKFRKLRVIISGGGTGGHIFPALSIANKLKEVNPETERSEEHTSELQSQ